MEICSNSHEARPTISRTLRSTAAKPWTAGSAAHRLAASFVPGLGPDRGGLANPCVGQLGGRSGDGTETVAGSRIRYSGVCTLLHCNAHVGDEILRLKNGEEAINTRAALPRLHRDYRRLHRLLRQVGR